MKNLFGAIEAGGTKFVCAVGTGPDDITEVRFPTTTPEETLGKALAFFAPYKGQLKSIGIGSFGPVDLQRNSPTYGFVTSTPKPGWADTEFAGVFARLFDLPVGFDTDVNGAALGEQRWGAAQGLDNFIYITMGTGIGGGVVAGGKLIHGLVHPELGHMFVPKQPDDTFAGQCPYHGDKCFEGVAAGPAIGARWGTPAHELPADHPAWDLQARYVATALASLVCSFSPQRIILGGGVMGQTHMLNSVREKTVQVLNGYIQSPAIIENINEYLVLPGLGDKAGILGAMVLAEQAFDNR